MKIILLNGAPFSGKDTLARQLQKQIPDSIIIRFKDVLYDEFSKRHNLPLKEVIELCSGPGKDQPQEVIGGLIPRQVLIDISENDIKKKRGENGVAMHAVCKILDTEDYAAKVFIFSDSGFENERKFLESRLLRYGLTKTILIRITRDGCDFSGVKDSRSFLKNPDYILTNDVDESNLPEEERGVALYNQFKTTVTL